MNLINLVLRFSVIMNIVQWVNTECGFQINNFLHMQVNMSILWMMVFFFYLFDESTQKSRIFFLVVPCRCMIHR